jgi:hypothetical protein
MNDVLVMTLAVVAVLGLGFVLLHLLWGGPGGNP